MVKWPFSRYDSQGEVFLVFQEVQTPIRGFSGATARGNDPDFCFSPTDVNGTSADTTNDVLLTAWKTGDARKQRNQGRRQSTQTGRRKGAGPRYYQTVDRAARCTRHAALHDRRVPLRVV